MDIVNAAVNLRQAQTVGQVQIAVAKKAMENQEMMGNSMLKLLQAASGGVARAGDEMVAAATGLGGKLDVYG